MVMPELKSNPNEDETAQLEAIKSRLLKIEPFCDLPEKVIETVAEIADFRCCNDGETVLSAGQYDGSLFVVVCKGSIKSARLIEMTGDMQLSQIRSGEIFGLPNAIAGDGSGAFQDITLTAAESSTELILIESDSFREIILQRPTLSRVLMSFFAELLVKEGEIHSNVEVSPTRTVYAKLLELVERDAIKNEWRIVKLPKHRELADLAGVEEVDAAVAIATIIQDGIARRDYPGLVVENMGELNRLAS